MLKLKTEVEVPVKEPIDVTTFDIPPDEYFVLASKVGYNPRATLAAQKTHMHLALLAELGLSVFPLAKVHSYLDSIYGRPRFSFRRWSKATWGWRRLQHNIDGYGNPTKNGMVLGGDTYERPIPYPVLLTIQQIQEKAGAPTRLSAPAFAVSDPTNEKDFYRDPDPFLACIWGGDLVVIERWDEPSFRME